MLPYPISNRNQLIDYLSESKALYVPFAVLRALNQGKPTYEPDSGIVPSFSSFNYVGSLTGTEIRIDWITATSHSLEDLPRVVKFLAELWGIDLMQQSRGADHYSHQLKNAYGVMVLFSPTPGTVNHEHFTIKIPGYALAAISSTQVIQLTRYLQANGFKFSRFDVALDLVNSDLIHIPDIINIVKSGDMTGVRAYQIIESGKPGKESSPTLYLGGRTSKRMIRFYDAKVSRKLTKVCELLDVDLKWIRLELELKHSCSHQFVQALLGFSHDGKEMLEVISDDKFPDKLSTLFRQALLKTCDFIQRREEAHGHIDRCDRYPFWEKILEDVQPFEFKPNDAVQSTENGFKSWVRQAAAPILCTLMLTIGSDGFHDWLYDVIGDGLERMKDKHQLVLSAASNNPENKPDMKAWGVRSLGGRGVPPGSSDQGHPFSNTGATLTIDFQDVSL